MILCPEKAPREMPVKSVNFHSLCFVWGGYYPWIHFHYPWIIETTDTLNNIFWILVRLK